MGVGGVLDSTVMGIRTPRSPRFYRENNLRSLCLSSSGLFLCVGTSFVVLCIFVIIFLLFDQLR